MLLDDERFRQARLIKEGKLREKDADPLAVFLLILDPTLQRVKKADKSDQRTLAVLTHILTLVAHFIAPLIILLVSKDEYVKKHARRALNWQISAIIYFVVSFVLVLVLVGIFLLIALAVLDLVFVIIAAVKAGNDELWDYPMAIRFLKD